MSLTLQQILDAQDVGTLEVPVPEWGGSVHVRQISALEGLRLTGQFRALQGTETEIAEQRLVIALATYLSDEQGKPLATPEQAKALLIKSQKVVERVVTAGSNLNGENDAARADIAKNSTPSRADSLPTA